MDHTGFKGLWLAIWPFSKLGAEVHGYEFSPNTIPNNYTVSNIHNILKSNTVRQCSKCSGNVDLVTASCSKYG